MKLHIAFTEKQCTWLKEIIHKEILEVRGLGLEAQEHQYETEELVEEALEKFQTGGINKRYRE